MPHDLVKMISLVCVLCFFSLVFGQEGLSDDEVKENLITTVTDLIIDGDLDEIKIKNLYLKYKYHGMSGKLKCKRGTARSMASLKMKETGGVNITKENNVFTITIPLEFSTLQYRYNSCKYKLLQLLRGSGDMSVTAGSNSLEVQATVTKDDGKCEARASSIKFLDVDKMRFDLSGHMGHRFKSRLQGPLKTHMKKHVFPKIIETLQIVIPLAFKNETLCNNFGQ